MLGRRIQVFFCALLAAVAVLCLVATLTSIGALGADNAQYLLKNCDGMVCLYRLPNRRTPVLISQIQTADLPSAEQLALASGIGVADYTEALARLDKMRS